MARTKGIMRKSTGGKAPRRQRAEPETQAPAPVNTPPAVKKSEEELLEENEIADPDGYAADIGGGANASRILGEMASTDNQDVKSESSEEDTDQAAPKTTLSNAQTRELCKQLEDACMERWDGEPLLELVELLREFRGRLSSRRTDAEFQDITY